MATESATRTRTETATDPRTGVTFTLVPETRLGTACAIISGTYLVIAMFVLLWFLGDAFSGRNTLVRGLLRFDENVPISPILAILLAAFIGGALGGIVSELRSFLTWHAERGAFGPRFIWKGIVAPWVGGALALFAIAIVQSGAALVGTTSSSPANAATIDNTSSATPAAKEAQEPTKEAPKPINEAPPLPLAVFAIGALAGYGSREVSIWLDCQVKRVFAVELATSIVPDLEGMTQEQAAAALRVDKLRLGNVKEVETSDTSKVDKIIAQTPESGAVVVQKSGVDFTIGRKPKEPEPAPPPAD